MHGLTDLIVDHQLELPGLEGWPPAGRQLSWFKNHEGGLKQGNDPGRIGGMTNCGSSFTQVMDTEVLACW